MKICIVFEYNKNLSYFLQGIAQILFSPTKTVKKLHPRVPHEERERRTRCLTLRAAHLKSVHGALRCRGSTFEEQVRFLCRGAFVERPL